MAAINTFNTLGFAKFLADNGFEKKQAEALAEAYYEFQINDLATKEFVRSELQRENALLEKRMTMTMGKMITVAVGVMLAGIPIIQAVIAKLG